MSKRVVATTINVVIALLLLPLCWISYIETSKLLGLRPQPVEVAGTGSMYPSLFWDESQGGPEKANTIGIEEYRSSPRMYHYFKGLTLGNNTYFKHSLGIGDMVAFTSQKTRDILNKEGKDPNLGFIKRIVGLEGDSIELRDGYLIRNGQIVDEPYIRSPRSTYGGSTLNECQKVTVPPNSYFVLGDNRKVSSDSRFELSFIKTEDIKFYLPYSKQGIYHSLWRDTRLDQELLGKSTLDTSEFYEKLPALKANNKLEKSASLRAKNLLENSTSGYDLRQALQDANYSNIVTGEFVAYGHYTATELWEHLSSNYETASQLQNTDYEEIGVSTFLADVSGCPTQVIVGHLGGYIPATYDQSTIDSWITAKNNLVDALPSWEKAIDVEGVDQTKLKELIDILHVKQKLIEEVLSVISKREWISPSLEKKIETDSQNTTRMQQLVKELNNQ